MASQGEGISEMRVNGGAAGGEAIPWNKKPR